MKGRTICWTILLSFIAMMLTMEVYAEVIRDPDGRIHRSKAAVQHFREANPCPATGKLGMGRCSDFVVDHMIPLCANGVDGMPNLQWQSKHVSKIKDKDELRLCAKKITLEAFKQTWDIK